MNFNMMCFDKNPWKIILDTEKIIYFFQDFFTFKNTRPYSGHPTIVCKYPGRGYLLHIISISRGCHGNFIYANFRTK